MVTNENRALGFGIWDDRMISRLDFTDLTNISAPRVGSQLKASLSCTSANQGLLVLAHLFCAVIETSSHCKIRESSLD